MGRASSREPGTQAAAQAARPSGFRVRANAPPGMTALLRSEPHDLLGLLAEAFDAELDDVAGLEEFRLRLHAQPDARRSSRDDDVAWLQHHELRAVPHDM